MSPRKKKRKPYRRHEDRNAWITAAFIVFVIIVGVMHAFTIMAVNEAEARLDAVENQQGKVIMFLTGGAQQ